MIITAQATATVNVRRHDKLDPLMNYMKGLKGRPTLEKLLEVLRSVDVAPEDLGEHVQYNSKYYHRNLIFENEHVQLLCLCWKSGQRSPIHDHANSICGVKIISGVASETTYEQTPSGYLKAVSTSDFGEGVVGSQDEDIHQMANLQAPGEDLITLHCYSPPLTKMKTFDIDSQKVQIYQPVNETHMDGSGI